MRKQPEPNVFLPPDTIFLSALAAGEKWYLAGVL